MSTAILEKNYKNLENRLESLENFVKFMFEDELTSKEINKLTRISEKLDKGEGRRLETRREFLRYLKAL